MKDPGSQDTRRQGRKARQVSSVPDNLADDTGEIDPSRELGPLFSGTPKVRPEIRNSVVDSLRRFGVSVRYMVLEEYRVNTSFASRWSFHLFPAFIFIIAFLSGASIEELNKEIPFDQLLFALHISATFYGLAMGSFAFMGSMILENRFGKVRMLLGISPLHPISFRTAVFSYFVRETVFYMLLVLTPLTCGIVASTAVAPISASGALFMSLSVTMTFVLGLSMAFFLAAIDLRSTRAFQAVLLLGLIILLHGIVLDHLGITLPYDSASAVFILIPSLKMHLSVYFGGSTLGLFLVTLVWMGAFNLFSVIFLDSAELLDTVWTVRKGRNELPKYVERYGFTRGYSALVGKEFLTLKRSRTAVKMGFSFIMPLTVVTLTTWYANAALNTPLRFNTLFYGSMIGFFGVMIYSWLNNIESEEYYSTLPVSVPTVIKTKLFAFMIMNMSISTIFVLATSILFDELYLFPVALLLMMSTSAYVVSSTAYLTGLDPNKHLFDMKVLIKFNFMSAVPLIAVALITLSVNVMTAVVILFAVCAVLIGLTIVIFKGIERKYFRAEF